MCSLLWQPWNSESAWKIIEHIVLKGLFGWSLDSSHFWSTEDTRVAPHHSFTSQFPDQTLSRCHALISMWLVLISEVEPFFKLHKLQLRVRTTWLHLKWSPTQAQAQASTNTIHLACAPLLLPSSPSGLTFCHLPWVWLFITQHWIWPQAVQDPISNLS